MSSFRHTNSPSLKCALTFVHVCVTTLAPVFPHWRSTCMKLTPIPPPVSEWEFFLTLSVQMSAKTLSLTFVAVSSRGAHSLEWYSPQQHRSQPRIWSHGVLPHTPPVSLCLSPPLSSLSPSLCLSLSSAPSSSSCVPGLKTEHGVESVCVSVSAVSSLGWS